MEEDKYKFKIHKKKSNALIGLAIIIFIIIFVIYFRYFSDSTNDYLLQVLYFLNFIIAILMIVVVVSNSKNISQNCKILTKNSHIAEKGNNILMFNILMSSRKNMISEIKFASVKGFKAISEIRKSMEPKGNQGLNSIIAQNSSIIRKYLNCNKPILDFLEEVPSDSDILKKMYDDQLLDDEKFIIEKYELFKKEMNG
ncbi:MAG: hypothetical protein K8R58_10625 [Bacteroidales bacterium]|nr:hypothetical protein [Bacteroidales bacterium]